MFREYITSFIEQLDKLNDLSSLKGYPGDYLNLLLQHKQYYLRIYDHVLTKAMENATRRPQEITLLDYGAGNGLLGMFAKHCGFKNVYLNDINDDFINAAHWLNDKLDAPVDAIIKGDWRAVEIYCSTNITPDIIVGTDVIEHIYNLESFFKGIKKMNADMITVFTTASVTANPVKNYQLKKLQQQDEIKGSNALHAANDNPYAGLPFLEIRKRIIKQHLDGLDNEMNDKLAKATRGLKYEDIVVACDNYINGRFLPITIAHPTNTCDPVTGSWTERLLTVNEYNKLYFSNGFILKVYNGFYNQWQPGVKHKLLAILNGLIKFYGYTGRYISPFITLVGKPK